MAITYPQTLPTTPAPQAQVWRQRNVVAEMVSPYTLQSQRVEHPGQAWEGELDVVLHTAAEAAAWEAFLARLHGKFGTFLMGHVLHAGPRGSAPGAPVVNGAGQTGNQLNTRGWTVSQSGILLEGDYIQVGSGATARLYMVVQDANSDGSGDATLEIWPRLRESPADGATVVTSNPQGVFKLGDNVPAVNLSPPEVHQLRIPVVEAL